MPNRPSATPLRRWWDEQTLDRLPDDLNETTRQLVTGFAGGAAVADLAAETGLTPDAILGRLQRVAVRLGYQPRERTAWLLPDGRVADHAVWRDPVSGCLLWRGQMRPSTIDPCAHLPPTIGEGTDPAGRRPQVGVRRYLWRRAGRPLAASDVLVATCGDVRCINLDHAGVRPRSGGVSAEDRTILAERKTAETAQEAASRLGIDRSTVNRYRGARGKRQEQPSELRDWLRGRWPETQPTGTHHRDWAFARAYVAGASVGAIGEEHGVSRQMVHMRITRLARALGWSPGSSERPS